MNRTVWEEYENALKTIELLSDKIIRKYYRENKRTDNPFMAVFNAAIVTVSNKRGIKL